MCIRDRDRASKNGIFELIALAPRFGFHFDPAIAELAPAAGLFLMPTLGVGLFADGLPVGYLRGLQVDLVRLDHGIGGTAYGYILSDGDRRLAYLSDMLRATAEVRQALSGPSGRDRLDLLVLGASHYYEGIETWKRSVMDVIAALELVRDVIPGRAVLTHLSHTVDYDEVTERLPESTLLAYDGLVVEV